jgi:predicted PurR-regulated permease PerM
VESGARVGRRERTVIIGDAVAVLARWTLRLILIGLGIYLLSYVVQATWSVLLPLVLALLLSSVLAPLADWLVAHGVGRTLAAAAVIVTFLLTLIVATAVLTRSIVGQIPEVADEATNGLAQVRDYVTGPPLELSETQVDNAIDAISDRLQGAASSIAAGVFSGVSAVGSVLVTGVLVLVLSFFFIKDGHDFLPWLNRVAGRRAGRHLSEVFTRWWVVLGSYVRTQLIVSFVDAVLIGIGLVVLGVPLAATLTALTFFGGFVPIVGAFVAGAVAVLVALVTEGTTTALLLLGIVILVQQLEGNVLSPWLQGRSLQLHAGIVLLAVTGGGTRYGLIGAFLAVPVAACVVVLLRYLSEQVDVAAASPPPVEEDRDSETPPGEPGFVL